METYHKIQTVFKRDPETKFKTLLEGQFSLPEFEYLKNNEWVFTEKVDGTNIRVMWDNSFIRFGGKTDKAQTPMDLIERLIQLFKGKEDILRELFPPKEDENIEVCFYGEGYGAGIQKGGCYQQEKKFILFDIKIGEWWLLRKDVEEIAEKLSIDIVPEIGNGTLSDMIEKTRVGFNSQWGHFKAEGIVARPKTELRTRRGARMITKIKRKDFHKGGE